MKNTRANSIKNIISKYKKGEITFGELVRRISIKPTVRNTVLILALIAALSTVKEFDIKGIVADKETTIETTDEVLEQMIITVPIKKGDTLDGIASRFGMTADEIAAYNGIADKNKIIAGTEINILLPLETKMDIVETYTVKKDETIDSICEDKDLTFEEFIVLNPEVTSVKEGDTLNIVKSSIVKEYRYYIVEENDTIKSVCEKFDMDEEHFLNINNFTKDSELYEGDAITVLTEEPFYVSYKAGLNESIADIAEKFGVSADQIMLINGVAEVKLGDVLVIPTTEVPTEKKFLGLF